MRQSTMDSRNRPKGHLINLLPLLICLGFLSTLAASAALARNDGAVAEDYVHSTALELNRLDDFNQQAGQDRGAEAIVVFGASLPTFSGRPIDQLRVHSFADGSWNRVPFQVDEKDASGLYLEAEDGLLDTDDELVIPYSAGGQERPDENSLPPEVPLGSPWVDILVSDPRHPDEDPSAFYLFGVSEPIVPPGVPPAISWDDSEFLLSTPQYSLGIATAGREGYFGFHRLEVNQSGVDMIDRLKFRGNLVGVEQNEENLASTLDILGIEILGAPVKVGPVRAVLSEAGDMAYVDRFGLAGVLGSVGGLVGGGLFDITDVRVSIDFSPEISGAEYRDANMNASVVVDGSPDEIPTSPLPVWREVRDSRGGLVILSDSVPDDSPASVYYEDVLEAPLFDTGDQKQFADMGVMAPTADDFAAAGFPREIVILAADAPADRAEVLADQAANPLQVRIGDGGGSVPETAPPPEDTPTPSPTVPTTAPDTPPPSPSATATETDPGWESSPIYLPKLVNSHQD